MMFQWTEETELAVAGIFDAIQTEGIHDARDIAARALEWASACKAIWSDAFWGRLTLEGVDLDLYDAQHGFWSRAVDELDTVHETLDRVCRRLYVEAS